MTFPLLLMPQGAAAACANSGRGMARSNIITASFASARDAAAAVDWFGNQRTPPDAVRIHVWAPGENPRPTRAGDNQRADLTWLVSIDVDRAGLRKRIAMETMKREGGKFVAALADDRA
jgi:hypothetical protein